MYFNLCIAFAGLPPQYRPGGKRLPQHFKRRLETGSEYKHHHLWTLPSFHGTDFLSQSRYCY